MAVDRRAFLQLVGASAAGAAVGLRGVSPVDPDIFESTSLGLRVRKPAGWHYITASEVWIRRNQLEVVGGEVAKQELYEMSGAPLLTTTRNRLPRFGAGLVTWVQLAHGDDISGAVDELTAAHEWTFRRYGDFLPDWEFLDSAAPAQFAGRLASRLAVRYSDPGDGTPIHMTSYLFRHGRVWLTFNLAVGARNRTTIDDEDFTVIERGITLTPQGPPA